VNQRPPGAIVRNANSVLGCELAMRAESHWARVIVAVFTVAVFYSSACSTNCAVGVCPNQPQQRPSHDCEESAAHHSHHSNTPAPNSPDCSHHSHPSWLLLKSVEIGKVQLVASSHFGVSTALVPLAAFPSRSSKRFVASDLGPPFGLSTPVYQQIPVLRI
jgi:hypothetical protein